VSALRRAMGVFKNTSSVPQYKYYYVSNCPGS